MTPIKKILVVDNNRTIVDFLASELSKNGFSTIKAFDGMEALDLVKKNAPDLIILDLIMPKIDGYRVAKYLKSHEKLSNIPVIILSAIAAEDKFDAFEVEVDAFVAKGPADSTLANLLTTIKWLEARKRPKRGILGIENLYPREITKELLLVKQHFDSMLRVMSEGVLEMDEYHRIFFSNDSASTLLGVSEIELFGKAIVDLFPDTPELVMYLEKLPKSKNARLKGIKLLMGDNILRLTATPFFFNRTFLGSISLLEDITQQIKKERALEELTSKIIQNAPIGIGLLDNDHRIVIANQHLKLLAHSRGNIERKPFLSLNAFRAKPFAELLREASDKSADSPQSREISFTLNKGRTMKTYYVTASPLFQQNGMPYLLLLVDDITDKAELAQELLSANQELKMANQAKSNFLSIVSHELRTPLSVIRGYISLILEGKIREVSGEALEALKTSDKRARHLQQLIEELLDITRIEAGKITLKRDLIALEKHIREVVDMFQNEIDHKKLDLQVSLPSDLPEVVADHDKIHQIFTNLISNAVKFTPDLGHIAICGHAVEGGVQISVKDSGIGIPEDKIPLIFDKFYQVDSTDTRLYGGSGLGLSIIRIILEANGGKINVASKPGSGSTFTVFLPIGPVSELKEKLEKETREKRPFAEPLPTEKCILLCEDDEDTIKIITYTLSADGYDLVVCRDGFEAIEKLYTRNIDLIMLDIRLPFMSGYDLCRIAKATKTTAHIPIIILSAAGQEDEVKKGYESGANEYIIKPFAPKKLLELIRKNLS